MAETTRISQLSAHDGKPAPSDMLVMVDVSDDTQSAEGSTKNITYSNLVSDLTVSLPNSATWDTAYTTVTANSAAWSSSTGGGGGSSTGGGQIHAVFNGNSSIVSKSNNWDTYVDSISFPQSSWNGYARINYKNSFTNLPTVLATADHRESVSNPHVFAQVQAQTVDHCDIVIGDAEDTQVQAAFNVVIFSDEIAGGGSSSTTLPAGSVLQKVVSAFPDITSLSTVGTEIASLDITPKASDSQLLCEITFLWQEQGTNGSQQQGKFYIDDVEFGGQWYNHISSTANRLQTSLRSIATISDTNTKTISHKLTLDDLDASRIGSIVMSIEEVAQSTYTL